MAPNGLRPEWSVGVTTGTWAREPTSRGVEMVAQAAARPYWLDRDLRPEPRPRLVGEVTADLLVIGGGLTGLWTAVQAAERDPSRTIVLVERDRIAEHASGRNGGFCAASLTHGLGNGLQRFRDEMPTLLRMGRETLDAIESTLARLGIDADVERTGELDLATTGWQYDALAETAAAGRALGEELVLLDASAARERVDSPMVRGATLRPRGHADRSGKTRVRSRRRRGTARGTDPRGDRGTGTVQGTVGPWFVGQGLRPNGIRTGARRPGRGRDVGEQVAGPAACVSTPSPCGTTR